MYLWTLLSWLLAHWLLARCWREARLYVRLFMSACSLMSSVLVARSSELDDALVSRTKRVTLDQEACLHARGTQESQFDVPSRLTDASQSLTSKRERKEQHRTPLL
jgi:hypothetical protein